MRKRDEVLKRACAEATGDDHDLVEIDADGLAFVSQYPDDPKAPVAEAQPLSEGLARAEQLPFNAVA